MTYCWRMDAHESKHECTYAPAPSPSHPPRYRTAKHRRLLDSIATSFDGLEKTARHKPRPFRGVYLTAQRQERPTMLPRTVVLFCNNKFRSQTESMESYRKYANNYPNTRAIMCNHVRANLFYENLSLRRKRKVTHFFRITTRLVR